MCVGEYTNYPEELMLFNCLFKYYAYICVKNQTLKGIFTATSKIPVFNIESLKTEIGISKDTLYEYFDLLNRAELMKNIRTESKYLKAFKNSKILFNSPNIYYAIAYESWKSDADKGNIFLLLKFARS